MDCVTGDALMVRVLLVATTEPMSACLTRISQRPIAYFPFLDTKRGSYPNPSKMEPSMSKPLTPEEKQRRVEEDEAMKEKAKEIHKQKQMQAKKVCPQGLQWNIC